jgi:hypothetical protein
MSSPPAGHITLPASQARRILDLMCAAEHVISALQARGQRGSPAMLASLEDLAALLTGGGNASQLTSDLQTAQRGLAAVLAAGSRQ